MPIHKSSKNYLIFTLLFVLVFFGGVKFWWDSSLFAPDPKDSEVKVFVIKPGESVSTVAENLKKEGLIKSEFAFKFYLRQTDQEGKIQAGDYKLSANMSVKELVEGFSAGSIDKWVTLIEGWRNEEIARKLKTDLGIDENEFLKVAKEGYMFPDTYLFDQKSTAIDISKLLKNTFEKKYTDEMKSKMKLKGLTADQGVVLASIVEREGRSDKVRTEVASILLKRFKIGMALNADATVQYAKDTQSYKTNKNLKFWQPITQEEYQSVKSSYNTYLHSGLPPGPICNPSLSSLNAVANADPNTPYLYYYHDSKGNSYYGKTLEEHNKNVANNP